MDAFTLSANDRPQNSEPPLHSPAGNKMMNNHQFEKFLQRLTAHLDGGDGVSSAKLNHHNEPNSCQYPERVMAVRSYLPMVDLEQVNLIDQNRFDPWDISRLRGGDYFDTLEKHGDSSDYPDFLTWLQYWTYYQSALLLLFPENHLLSCALALHLHHITRWERLYSWPSVLTYCMAYHHEAIRRGVTYSDSWMYEIPEFRDTYFTHSTLRNSEVPQPDSIAPTFFQPKSQPLAKRSVPDGEVARRSYSYGHGSFPDCRWQGFCLGCGSNARLYPECRAAPVSAAFAWDFGSSGKRKRLSI